MEMTWMHTERTRSNTVNSGSPEMEQLSTWAKQQTKTADALRKAAKAAELASILWDNLPEERREALAADPQIAWLTRAVIGSYAV